MDELLVEALVPKEEQPYEVPENWVWTNIKILADVKGGKRLPKGESLLEEETDHPYLRVADFKDGSIDENSLKYITKDTYQKISRYTITNEDVYISIAGTIGKVGIIPFNLNGANLTENAARITNIKCTNNNYLYHVLKSNTIKSQIKMAIKATSQPKLALHRIQDLKVSLPPLTEQKRIVNKVERLLNKIDQAKQLIEEAKETFELRRAAILDKAFRGELTSKWREKNNISFCWGEKSLGELIEIGPQNGLYKPKSAYGKGSLIVRIDNFYNGSINNWGSLKRLQLEEKEVKLYGLRNDDLIINRVNSIEYLGKSALVRDLREPCVFESNVMRLRLNKMVVPEFMILYLNSSRGLQELRKNAKHAVNQASINQQDVKNVIVPLPEREEQLAINRIVNIALMKEERVENFINLTENLNQLKQSILSKAFRGELGTNDPAEESAIELLKEVLQEQII